MPGSVLSRDSRGSLLRQSHSGLCRDVPRQRVRQVEEHGRIGACVACRFLHIIQHSHQRCSDRSRRVARFSSAPGLSKHTMGHFGSCDQSPLHDEAGGVARLGSDRLRRGIDGMASLLSD